MRGKMINNLIVIENGQLNTYILDDKLEWELGRPSGEKYPDIKLYSSTISRKHGKFQNMDGIWFYLDYNGKNGTIYNGKHITGGINGRVKPIMLSDGDVFVFGGGDEFVVNHKTVWAMYSTQFFDENWRIIDTKSNESVSLSDGKTVTKIDKPVKGTVIKKDKGIAIYMGALTYLIGEIDLV